MKGKFHNRVTLQKSGVDEHLPRQGLKKKRSKMESIEEGQRGDLPIMGHSIQTERQGRVDGQ